MSEVKVSVMVWRCLIAILSAACHYVLTLVPIEIKQRLMPTLTLSVGILMHLVVQCGRRPLGKSQELLVLFHPMMLRLDMMAFGATSHQAASSGQWRL